MLKNGVLGRSGGANNLSLQDGQQILIVDMKRIGGI